MIIIAQRAKRAELDNNSLCGMTAAADAVVRRVLVRIVRRSVTVVALGCSVLGNFEEGR